MRRNPAVVIEEIQAAAIRYGVQDIALYDDAFLVDPARHALPILEAAAERVPGMRWHTPNGLHASAIDRSVASAMKRAGFETIRLGLESSSDEFHARTGGKTDIQGFLKAVANLKEAGFSSEQIGAYLLVGLPGQSKAVIEDDVRTRPACRGLPQAGRILSHTRDRDVAESTESKSLPHRSRAPFPELHVATGSRTGS